jgi:Flp pilus assembly protein TadG
MMRLRFNTRADGLFRRRAKKRGQALVEFALMGLILGMLLAAAVDFGRAYYTALIVENMAGEGAAYAAKWPMNDLASQGCAGGSVQVNKNIQDRARQVASDRGLVIRQPSQADVAIDPPNCFDRCPGVSLKVTVTYRMNDLFLPSLLGMQSITIKKSATQWVEAPAHRETCSGSDGDG